MHWVVYNVWYNVADQLGLEDEAEKIFVEAEKFLSETKLSEELFRLYNLKVSLTWRVSNSWLNFQLLVKFNFLS